MDGKVYLTAAWGGIALIALATLLTAALGDWLGVLILGLFLALSIIFVRLRWKLPHLFDLLFVLASIINAAGYVWDLFSTVPFYDKFAHLFTTFAISLALGFLFYESVLIQFRSHGFLFVVMIASLGLSIGALWEVFEYVTGLSERLPNAIGDLVADTIGALAGGIVAAVQLKRARMGRA